MIMANRSNKCGRMNNPFKCRTWYISAALTFLMLCILRGWTQKFGGCHSS